MESNDGRPVVVVTGAAGALGTTLVHYLAAQRNRVVAIDRPHAGAKLADVAREAAGIVALELDSTSADTWSPVIERITSDLGPPTAAVLVAGGYRGGARMYEGDADSVWQAMLQMNLDSARVAMQALLPSMVAARNGSIVLVSSRAAVRPWESAGAAAYAASKAALLALMQATAAEVLDDGVRINAVLPSVMDTAANRAAMPKAERSRWVAPASLSEVIAFLLSPAARDITGAALPVYGRVGV